MGPKLGEQKAAEAEAADRGELAGPPPAEMLVLAADGAHVNTREEGWKETKVAVRCRRQTGPDGRAALKAAKKL